MKLNDIINFIEKKIPKELALDYDNVALMDNYDLNEEIRHIKILMDLYPEYDDNPKDTLLITHHTPLFKPKTPTYTIHSNWDIIDGGANEALADTLGLKVISPFDNITNIGRICEFNHDFKELKDRILDKFESVRIVNEPHPSKTINTIGIISGFGLKNPDYIGLARDNDLDILISGDLTQETAVLAKNLDLTLIDLGHHESEIPGLYRLYDIVNETGVECEVIDIRPIQNL